MRSKPGITPLRRAAGCAERAIPHDDKIFDWGRRWGVEKMYDLVFKKAATDMAMAQVVPMFDSFKDWYVPIKSQHAMAQAHPDRVGVLRITVIERSAKMTPSSSGEAVTTASLEAAA